MESTPWATGALERRKRGSCGYAPVAWGRWEHLTSVVIYGNP